MLKDVQWSEDRSYKAKGENEPFQFYIDALCNSNRLDLLLGYFSSAAISVLSLGFATFLHSGGRMRMIFNNILSEKDRDAIRVGQAGTIDKNLLDLTDIKNLKRSLDEYGLHFFECVSWLIANKRIEIKIIRPKEGEGIAHYKNGIFYDGTDYVGFSASCNFTAYGLLENLERLEAFLGWENRRSTMFTNGLKKDFEEIFAEENLSIEYLTVEDIEVALINEFGGKNMDELIIQEKELSNKKEKLLENKKVRKSFEKAITHIEEIIREPRFPFVEGPRGYQVDAYNNWVSRDYSGVFAMATGTGKTITSMNCVLNEFKKTKTYRAIIVVPTIVLVEQWAKEARSFNFTQIIIASSKNSKWKEDLTEIKTKESFGIKSPYIVITTYKSFASERFQEFISPLNGDNIFIADEAHNLGAGNVKSKLPNVKIHKRIGLSATPKRAYDPEGSIEIESFFKDNEPFTYSFSMERAIEEGILCQYYYYPKIVTLQEDETKKYNEISLRLAKLFQMSGLDEAAKGQYEMLLMQRKSIIHKAKNKFEAFKSIVSNMMKSNTGLKYTLVYAPEGYHSDDEFIDEEFPDLDNESRIIDLYSNIIRTISPDTHVAQYTSISEEKESLLKDFESGKLNILLSMKCLDEGVDIPRTEQAIFCSSTGNPRQFIQRRGRILRNHKDKKFAKIHDLIVVPSTTAGKENFEIERRLIKKELERVVHFAYMAINKYEALEILKNISEHYDLNLDTLHLELKS